MKSDLDVTRRDFMRTAALVSASAAVGRAVGLPGIDVSSEALAQEPQPSHEVAMGSVFPYVFP